MLDGLWSPDAQGRLLDGHIALVVAMSAPSSILEELAGGPDAAIAVIARSVAQKDEHAATIIAPMP